MSGSHTGSPGSDPKRVLVIEDNRDFARLFSDMLEIMGCVADIAFDGRSGLEAARRRIPDMIFCDLGLPGELDGFAFARALRGDASLAGVPLVGVSGRTAEEDIQRAINAGFDRVYPKPVKFADVSNAIAFYANGRHAG